MQRRTFIIGAAGLAATPGIATAEAGWSEPMAIHFAPGSAEIGGRQWSELEAVFKAFQERPNPRNGDSVRVTGYMDEAERSQFLRALPMERAQSVADAFNQLDRESKRARPRRATSLLVQERGSLEANRVVLVSWRVAS